MILLILLNRHTLLIVIVFDKEDFEGNSRGSHFDYFINSKIISMGVPDKTEPFARWKRKAKGLIKMTELPKDQP